MSYTTIIALAARTAAGVSDTFSAPNGTDAIMVQQRVTVEATDAGDLLSMWLQGSLDGTTFFDIGRFADVAGNAGAESKKVMIISRRSAAETELLTGTDAAMAVSTVTQGPFPDLLRVKWTVTDAGTDDASFTFSVSVGLIR